MDNNLIPYQPVISDIKNLIAAGQNVAYNAANRAMIMTYWNIGKRIVEEEQNGAERAEYGKRLISILSDELTKEFGSLVIPFSQVEMSNQQRQPSVQTNSCFYG